MSFRVQLPEEANIQTLSQEAFQRQMGIQYLSHLTFQTPRLLAKIQNAIQKEPLNQKQRWLGKYFQKEIQEGYTRPLLVKWIDSDVGYGAFAEEVIPKFTFIGEYVGLVRKRSLFRRNSNTYCFDYPIGDLKSPYVIDAKDQGNLTRFINHSDHPNLEPAAAYSEGLLHIILFTKEVIAPGTQLVYDYGEDFWAGRKKKKVF
jgi:hypothetical protein